MKRHLLNGATATGDFLLNAALAPGRYICSIGTPEASLAHQRADEPCRVGGVDRHREAEPDSGDCGVDPDDAAAAVRRARHPSCRD